MPGINLGFITIQYYGMILMFGALAGAWLAALLAKRQGLDPDIAWDGLIWVLIGGIIGSRLWHIFTPTASNIAAGLTTSYYLTHPLDALNIKQGGLGIPGAVIGGAVALFLFTRRRGISFGRWADLAAPGLALGQAIGRWGNFVNQEVYGAPSNLPWAITIDEVHRLPGFENAVRYHPLFLYESLWNLGLLALLLWLGQRYRGKLKRGDLFLVYLVGYPTVRFFLEYLRLDTSPVSGLNINQTIMAFVAITAAIWLYWRHRPGAPTEKPEPTPRASSGRASTNARRSSANVNRMSSEQTPEVDPSPSSDESDQTDANDNAANLA